ncbi:MAG: HlyD family efflux transporter periplasmic adaptor subunit [Gammaproteobacteria bacterium]|nr:HlyD family efflux transporter periplasmic adaptor subunit [Gammaproteobacteria bacterium]MCP4980497.1 HlyD family efflux transporter periplasmic adaptor subunit [Gammaproteobacteria bacterium]
MHSRFSEKWLETVCSLLPGVNSAVFMVPDQDNTQMHLLARWPQDLDQSQDFFAIVKYALKKHGEVCLSKAHVVDGQALDYFAKPVFIRSKLAGVLAIKMKHLPAAKHLAVFHSITRSIRWLGLASFIKPESADDEFYSSVVGVLASCFEQGSYQQGLMRMVAELTSQFNCERVAFAELQGHHCQVIALSNSAEFEQRSNLVRKIEDAMDEAVEQDSAIMFPDKESITIQRAHRELARIFGSGSIATLPLISERKVFGAITLLCSEELPLQGDTLELCQQTLSLLAPFLALKKDQERGIFSKILQSLGDGLRGLFGVKHLRAKITAAMLTAFLVMTSLVEVNFRVTADAVLEGEVQRVVAAPISGYLLSSAVRAGDTISKGEIMASLNDSELRLELTKLNGRLQKSKREYREAQSTRDLVKVRVIKEQINQAKAEIDLVDQQLDSINLSAPFDGIVIEGDLSQMLGSPVERGDALFKIAPLEGYRIILKVDESEISYVEQGQAGSLTLSSLSKWNFPLQVERITSVAKAEDGANIFRVEASLPNAPELLRPGMQGIGKINAGRERLVWIWSHEIIDWFRLWVWSWWP